MYLTKTNVFDQIKDNVSWLPSFNDNFSKWKHLLNSIWVTEALNRSQKGPNMVLNGKFSQPYDHPVWVQAYVQNRLFLVNSIKVYLIQFEENKGLVNKANINIVKQIHPLHRLSKLQTWHLVSVIKTSMIQIWAG